MAGVVRGGVYVYQSIRRGYVLVVSTDSLNRAGTAIVVDVVEQPPPEDLRTLVTVPLREGDPMPGAWVLCWHLGFVRAERLEVDSSPGRVSAATMERVVAAIRALVEE